MPKVFQHLFSVNQIKGHLYPNAKQNKNKKFFIFLFLKFFFLNFQKIQSKKPNSHSHIANKNIFTKCMTPNSKQAFQLRLQNTAIFTEVCFYVFILS